MLSQLVMDSSIRVRFGVAVALFATLNSEPVWAVTQQTPTNNSNIPLTSFAGNAVGSWQNLQGRDPSTVFAINNTDVGGVASFDFGTPFAIDSVANLFTFNGVGSDGGVGFTSASEVPFSIGRFSYRNGGTTAPSTLAINAIDLSIGLSLTAPGTLTRNFDYGFGIQVVPNNTGDPVLDGDIATIASRATSASFNLQNTDYTLTLLGFSIDGGSTFTTRFDSPEDSTTTAEVFATITTNLIPVPEPTSLALLGGGLLGFAGLRRQQASRSPKVEDAA